jgi:hypothetical protein
MLLTRQVFRLLAVLLVAALMGVQPGCAIGQLHSKPGTTTTVILLRHAERDFAADELNAEGRERAQALVAAVGGMGVTAIYSPDLKRNLDTVRPLAAKLGIEITVKQGLSVFTAKDVVEEMLSKHGGGIVVYVGNVSGNLQMVYRFLGGTDTGPEEYGDLFVVTVPDQGRATVDKRRF